MALALAWALWLVLAKAVPAYPQTAPAAQPGGTEYATGTYARVIDVVVEGNRKTRRDNVLREMSLLAGDTLWLDRVEEALAREERLLLNTNLFSEVEVLVATLDTAARTAILRAVVREKWYLYPAVDFDLADRNFNVWWNEQNRSLDRVNYGVKLRHGNTTGRGDRLTLFVQGGYTRKAEVKYEIPYVNRRKTFGLELAAFAGANREWGFRTEEGLLRFLDLDTAFVLERQRYRGAIVFRPGIFTQHLLRLERQRNRAAPRLAEEANPAFFGDARERQDFWGLRYEVTHDRRDVRPFPIEGYYVRAHFEKLGLGREQDINRLNLGGILRVYRPLGQRLSVAVDMGAKTDLVRTPVPYFNRTALGFDEAFVRGYQFYVADGLDFAYVRNTLRYKVLDRQLRFRWSPIKRLAKIPLKLFVATTGDVAGANDPFDTPGNVLANEVLYSYGVGVYAVVFYGKVLRFEVTRNGLGEWGGFFRYSLGF